MTAAAPPPRARHRRRAAAAQARRDAAARPGLLITARTQRWAPEELLRTLVEAEITARDASNVRTRMKTAAFPVIKTLDELDRSACSIPVATLDVSPPWNGPRQGELVPGRAVGTGKSHVLVALGIGAVWAGHKVRYFTAAELAAAMMGSWITLRPRP
jgi:DNA replication protein DnaC